MLIIGLGNPGKKYEYTRHNIGFMAVDYLSETNGIQLNKKTFNSYWGKGSIDDKEIILSKPQTFMNLSGNAVKSIVDFFNINIEELIVIYDDIDLEFGNIRIRSKGGSGGHKGMESIIDCLGTRDFSRIRLGIGRPEHKTQDSRLKTQDSRLKTQDKLTDMADYVLSNFAPDEKDILKQMLNRTKDAVDIILKDGIEKAMNGFNKITNIRLIDIR